LAQGLERLIAGYREFRQGRWLRERELYEALADDQRPRAFVISCCDSRVDPATIFNARPGELFVARNVANLVPPFEQSGSYHGTSAAIEFAVTALKVESILVLGHARCGGVAAALMKADLIPGSFLAEWIRLLDSALQRCGDVADRQTAVERESVRLSLERLEKFPFVAEAMRSRGLTLHGARFGIADGRLEILDRASGEYRYVD
jgi:carbonic anhydrase